MLSIQDIDRARYHLGYMNVTVASSFAFGIPQSTETQWMFEDAINRVRPESQARLLGILDQLDCIEEKLKEVVGDLSVRRADGLEINLDQGDMLEREYCRWGARLADMLGVLQYPYAQRFQQVMRPKAGNISVRR